MPLAAQTYVPPSNRVDVLLDDGWLFIQQDVSGAQETNFDDSAWSAINLPHVWDIPDGQDGPSTVYYRGIGWYRDHFTVDSSYAGQRFFIKFDGAFLVADVYFNGNYLGEHQGGFAAFTFDVTPYLNVGAENLLAVKVNNALNTNVPPLNADFTFWGGIYRDAHLLVTSPVQISPLDYGSPGVYLQSTSVSSNAANLQVTTVVSNANPLAAAVTVRAVITDAATNIIALLTNEVTLPQATVSNVVANTTILNPHLWNGLYDPYLYQVYVELWEGTNVVDVLEQPLGFRYFSVDPTNGFFLNGQHYDLHGVDMHQDWLNCGWALTNAQRESNFAFIKEIGATAIRLSHYEHNDQTYQLGDQNGVILWSEVPNIDGITASSAYTNNTLQQLREMIRQRLNHPSIVCWGMYNEITTDGGNPAPLIALEVQLANQEDPTRQTTAAANSSDDDPTTLYTSLICFNHYDGWYSGVMADFPPWADNFHATYPTRKVGVSEYGCGASIYQHSENPVSEPANAGPYHPEEYQNLFHEFYWQAIKARPFLWGTFIWNMFDFASDGRDEGDTPGRNDKGLVTYDRQVRKDAFYWYKANWTTNPMVYITGHTFTNRLTNFITGKAYANCDSVELFVNGVSQGAATSTNCIFTWPLMLQPGSNWVQAVGTKGSTNVADSLFWMVPLLPPSASITVPATPTYFLANSNDTLQLAAIATDNAASTAPSMTTDWLQLSGPGTVAFGDPSALDTTARFSTNGVYALAFQASKGTTNTSIGLTVVVGDVAYGPALKVRFPFDDAGSGTTTPSDTSTGGANLSLQMLNKNGAATNLHGAANSGVAGLTMGNRALNLSSNSSQGASGNFVAATNSALGFGNITNFTLTMWFKQSVGLPANIGPRMFVLGNSTNTDCGTANSIGMKFQDAADLYFYVNTVQATAAFGSNLPTNSWIFVAMVYDGTNVMLYEGSDQTAAALISATGAAGQTVPLSATAASLFIGNRLGKDRDFAGWIDDFRFYTGAGDWSFIESVRQAASGPTGLAAIPGNNQVLLTWNPPAGAISFNIKRSNSSGGPYSVISPAGAVTGTNYTDFTAVNGMTYYYVVSAATSISEAAETANSPTEASALVGCTSVPAPVAGYNAPMYAGMTLCLTASPVTGATYAWTGPNGFSATNQNPVLAQAGAAAAGTYHVIATVAGCSSPAASTLVGINPPARLSAQTSTGSLVLSWPYGTLQSATNVTGPWVDLAGSSSPCTNVPAGLQQFYRIRLQ